MNEAVRKYGEADRSDTLVVVSPHGLRLSNSIGVISTEYLNASLSLRTRRIRRKYRTDRKLASEIVGRSAAAQSVSFIVSSGPSSIFPLDFGTVIPLHFFGRRDIVSIGQPRIWDHRMLADFGKTLAEAAMDSEDRVSIIISADQAHTHSSVGPYGYAEESAGYEDTIEQCMRKSDMGPLLEMTEDYVDKAKPDSYWNMIILHGLMERTGLRTHLDYHYVEKYFGMLAAHLE